MNNKQENNTTIIKSVLLNDLKSLINQGKGQVVSAVNSAVTITYWHVGKRINKEVLNGERAKYGEQVIVMLAKELVQLYGKSFEYKNLRRMMQFAEVYPNFEIVVSLSRQLSWSHFVVLIPLKSEESRLFYAQTASESGWSTRELRNQIERKAFERSEIANIKLKITESEKFSGKFKDPYFFDFLGLKDGYLESDLETALLKELELFILELGKGFTFIERQKRMIIDGEVLP